MEKKCERLNLYCYVCGQYTPTDHGRGYVTEDFKTAYRHYFNGKEVAFESWAPSTVCKSCYNGLMDWKSGRRERMSFGTPMEWMDFTIHTQENCYACKNYKPVMNRQKMKGKYIGVWSAILPLPHGENIPVPKFPSPDLMSDITMETEITEFTERSSNYSLFLPPPSVLEQPILITQNHLDLIVSKLDLSQRKSELLASFLKSKFLLAPGTKVTAYRKRQAALQRMFAVNEEKSFSYCHSVEELMEAMEINYEPDDWRLFIDSSSTSLKAVLLHKTNKLPSIPVAYNLETKETYEIMETILKCVKYDRHQWRVCCDLKVVAMLAGLQAGYVKYTCFICDWDSRYKGNQYACHNWKPREESQHGTHNIIREMLVPKDKIMLPPLHIKLGIVKNFIKTVAKKENVLKSLIEVFPRMSDSKLKNGVLNGPDIRRLMKAGAFEKTLDANEKLAWIAIIEVIEGLLGKTRSSNYKDSVEKMLRQFSKIGVHMSLKIHFLHHHLPYFSRQLATESDEQGERYHQVALPFEMRYFIFAHSSH